MLNEADPAVSKKATTVTQMASTAELIGKMVSKNF